MTSMRRASGCLFGLAFGDALGAPTEFLKVDEILARFPPDGPTQLEGLLCFLLYPDDPSVTIRRAAVTRGDSDSIACLAGAFVGAYHGFEAWPKEWIKRIEYAGRLAMLGSCWD